MKRTNNNSVDVEVFDKPSTLVRGTLQASKNPNKKRQGFFDKRYLTKEQVSAIINCYETCRGKANRASNKLDVSPKAVAKYWREAGLKVSDEGNKLPQKEINKILKVYKNCRSLFEASKKLSHSPKTILKYWREAGLKPERLYRGYSSPLNYYFAHQELRHLGRMGLSQVDSGLHRALIRHEEIDEAIPEKRTVGRHSPDKSEVEKILFEYS